MSKVQKITAETTLEEARAMAVRRRRAVELKVMRDIRAEWKAREAAKAERAAAQVGACDACGVALEPSEVIALGGATYCETHATAFVEDMVAMSVARHSGGAR